MKKKYVVARYFRGHYVETMCEPKTKKEAEILCRKLTEKEDSLNSYKVEKIGSTLKRITYL